MLVALADALAVALMEKSRFLPPISTATCCIPAASLGRMLVRVCARHHAPAASELPLIKRATRPMREVTAKMAMTQKRLCERVAGVVDAKGRADRASSPTATFVAILTA